MKNKKLFSIIAACSVILTGCGTSNSSEPALTTESESSTREPQQTITAQEHIQPPTTAPESETRSIEKKFDTATIIGYVQFPVCSDWSIQQDESTKIVYIFDEHENCISSVYCWMEEDPSISDEEIYSLYAPALIESSVATNEFTLAGTSCITYNVESNNTTEIMFAKNHAVYVFTYFNDAAQETIDYISYMISACCDTGDVSEYYDEHNIFMESYKISEDYKGNKVLVVDYKWTNTSDAPKNYILSFNASAYQNGIECDNLVFGCDDYDNGMQTSDILPGASVTVQDAYILQDTSDVTLYVTAWLDSSDLKYQYTIPLQ